LYLQKLTRLSREDNAKSIETLKKNGVTVIDPNSQAALDSYAQLGRDARKRLAGKLFSEDLLRRLEKSLADYRTSNGTKSK
jgi:TRAP-type C4-dicarboxylate transport system substrate-binding protein